jgi:hypothetical protein
MLERTVDTWVASAICSVFPDARIWDPTQAMRGRNWDRAFLPLGAGKVFIFEDKGNYGGDAQAEEAAADAQD